MNETSMGGIRLLLLVHGPFAGVLNRKSGGDDEHFPQCFFRARL